MTTERTREISRIKAAMPAGTRHAGGLLVWTKRGGYAGEKMIARTVEKLTALGFAPAGDTSGGNPDGSVVTSGSRLVNPAGDVASYASRYGVEAADNGYSITVDLAAG